MKPGRPRPVYGRVEYAQAFGLPIIDVPEWNTAVLRRPIPASDFEDAIGCYPLSFIDPMSDLEAGLDRLRAAGLVTVSLVPNPLTSPDPDALAAAFAVCRPFKNHYLIDRSESQRISATHRRWMRKALRECEVSRIRLRDALADWNRLYGGTIERHAIGGLQKFSPEYFAALAELPGIEAFAAFLAGEIVAMALWVDDEDIVYYHLGASDERGYKTQAMYGIFAVVFEHFASARILHLGGAAGVAPEAKDGLAHFKRGFANRELEAYFCGACLDAERYAGLSAGREGAVFFPAYRQT